MSAASAPRRTSGSSLVAARARAGACSASPRSARRRRCAGRRRRPGRPARSTSPAAPAPARRAASRSSLLATTAPTNTIRGRGSAAIAGSTGPGSSAVANSAGVGDVGRVEHVVVERAHALGQRRRAGQHDVGAGGEARLRRAEGRRVDALLGARDVVDAVVDDRARRPAASTSTSAWGTYAHSIGVLACPSAPRRAAAPARGSRRALRRRAPARSRGAGARAATARAARRRPAAAAQAADEPARHPPQIAPGELRPAQPERLDEQHPVVARARRDIRCCWLVHSSVSQSAKPTQTMSRPVSVIAAHLQARRHAPGSVAGVERLAERRAQPGAEQPSQPARAARPHGTNASTARSCSSASSARISASGPGRRGDGGRRGARRGRAATSTTSAPRRSRGAQPPGRAERRRRRPRRRQQPHGAPRRPPGAVVRAGAARSARAPPAGPRACRSQTSASRAAVQRDLDQAAPAVAPAAVDHQPVAELGGRAQRRCRGRRPRPSGRAQLLGLQPRVAPGVADAPRASVSASRCSRSPANGWTGPVGDQALVHRAPLVVAVACRAGTGAGGTWGTWPTARAGRRGTRRAAAGRRGRRRPAPRRGTPRSRPAARGSCARRRRPRGSIRPARGRSRRCAGRRSRATAARPRVAPAARASSTVRSPEPESTTTISSQNATLARQSGSRAPRRGR